MTRPFLKWPGGKRWLIQNHRDVFLPVSGTYFEPFLGAGAAFFMTAPLNAQLSDANIALINVYQQIRRSPSQFEVALKHYHSKHSTEFYYQERGKIYNCNFERAVQFIYLNRTCFNGIYRVNRDGKFNVPIGTKTTVFAETDDFLRISAALQSANLASCDFEESIGATMAGDFVYADPPYTVKHNMNGFVKYNRRLFQWSDQERLEKCLNAAVRRGVNVLVSNANHESIANLYGDFWEKHVISRSSVISAKSMHRGSTTELLISSFKIPHRPLVDPEPSCKIGDNGNSFAPFIV